MRGLFGRLGEMFGGSPQPNVAERGNLITKAMEAEGLKKINERSPDLKAKPGEKPAEYTKIQKEFTPLAFEAKNMNSPEAVKVLKAAEKALEELGRGTNIAANEKIVADAMREAKNILSGTITPEFSSDEYAKAMEFAKQSEHQQKVAAWMDILRLQTDGLSEAELRTLAEQKVAGVEEDLDETLPGVDSDESQEELRPTGT